MYLVTTPDPQFSIAISGAKKYHLLWRNHGMKLRLEQISTLFVHSFIHLFIHSFIHSFHRQAVKQAVYTIVSRPQRWLWVHTVAEIIIKPLLLGFTFVFQGYLVIEVLLSLKSTLAKVHDNSQPCVINEISKWMNRQKFDGKVLHSVRMVP